MPTSHEINTQILDAQRRKTEAEAAERERQLAAQAPQQVIAQADAELRELHAQRDTTAYREALQANEPLIEANKAAVDALYTLLNTPNGPDWWERLTSACQRLHETFERQRAHRETVLGLAQRIANNAFPFPAGGFQRGDWQAERAYDTNVRNRFGELAMHIRASAVPVNIALTQYVAMADSPKLRQRRQGLSYALLGQLVNPDEHFSQEAALKVLLDQRGY